MISVERMRFAYPNGDCALRIEGFAVNAGEAVGISGPSGVGKTTFLRLLAGLLAPQEGTVQVSGEIITTLSPSGRRRLRLRQCGLVFQDFELLPYLTVEENVLLPSRLGAMMTAERRTHGRAMIERLELGHHWKRRVQELSQGERQRVAIARALVHEPATVLADEPTSSLDDKRKALAMDLLLSYAKQRQAALVLVSHDPAVFQKMDRVAPVEDWKGLGTP